MTTTVLSKTHMEFKKILLMTFSIPLMASSNAFAVLACYAAAVTCADAAYDIIKDIKDPKPITSDDVADRLLK